MCRGESCNGWQIDPCTADEVPCQGYIDPCTGADVPCPATPKHTEEKSVTVHPLAIPVILLATLIAWMTIEMTCRIG